MSPGKSQKTVDGNRNGGGASMSAAICAAASVEALSKNKQQGGSNLLLFEKASESTAFSSEWDYSVFPVLISMDAYAHSKHTSMTAPKQQQQ